MYKTARTKGQKLGNKANPSTLHTHKQRNESTQENQ